MNSVMRVASFITLFFFFASAARANVAIGVVSVPVTDVRASSGSEAKSLEYDDQQETQLLYGEPVQILEENDAWMRIEAPQQQEYSHNNRWQGYPGWVKKSHIISSKPPQYNFVVQKKIAHLFPKPKSQEPIVPLSIGTQLYGTNTLKDGFRKVRAVKGNWAWVQNSDIRPLNPAPAEEWAREKILAAGAEMLGDPYFWGGRSAHIPELAGQVSAVDCSGFTSLAYRVAGIEIPRDSLEQFMKSRKIQREALRPADLIFVASAERPQKVTHVALYVDNATLLEAPRTGEKVRRVSFEEKFGVPLSQIVHGQPFGDRVVYFGTFFGNR